MDANGTKAEKTHEARDILNDIPELFDCLPDLPDIDEIFPPDTFFEDNSANKEWNETPIVDRLGQAGAVLNVNQVPVQQAFSEQSQPAIAHHILHPSFQPMSPFQQQVPSQAPAELNNGPCSTRPTYSNPLLSRTSQYALSPGRYHPNTGRVVPYASPFHYPKTNVQESLLPMSAQYQTITDACGDVAANTNLNLPKYTGNAQGPFNLNMNDLSQTSGVKRSNDEAKESARKRIRRREENKTLTSTAQELKGSVLKIWAFRGHNFKQISVEHPVGCETCGKQYATIHQLNKHTRTLHTNVRRDSDLFTCSYCNSLFKNHTNLHRHITNAHKEDNVIYCPHENCSANFGSKHALVLHERDYHNIVPESRKKKEMNRQKRIELGKVESSNGNLKAYVCDTCNAVTDTKGNLMRHIKIVHLRECDFVCNRCSSIFRTKSNLQAHQSSRTCLQRAQQNSLHNSAGPGSLDGPPETTEDSQESGDASEES